MKKEYTNTFYQIVTKDNKFVIYMLFDEDITCLEINQQCDDDYFFSAFEDVEEIKNILPHLNKGSNFFKINDQEYCLKDKRNIDNTADETQQFKIIKTTRHVIEEISIEEI